MWSLDGNYTPVGTIISNKEDKNQITLNMQQGYYWTITDLDLTIPPHYNDDSRFSTNFLIRNRLVGT